MSDIDNKNKIFRKVALDRLSSPEQLDMMMRVITPKAWLAVIPLLVLIFLGLVWGVFGSVPHKILANKCILINPTGLADITSESSGRVVEMKVKVGDEVVKGMEIAQIAHPQLEEQIRNATSKVNQLEALSNNAHSFADQSGVLTETLTKQNQAALESKINAARERAKYASDRARIAQQRILVQKDLFSQGLVTNQSVLSVEQEASNFRQEEVAANIEIQNLKNEIDQLKLSKLERSKQGNSEKATADIQYSEAKRELDILLQLKNRTGVVESQYQGRVIEIKAGVGMLVGQGEPIITVERTNLENQISTIEAIIYVPVGEGKKVRSGMVAQVVPSTIKREEHGFIFAHVSHVSDYPATPSSMKLILQNDALVRDLSGDTPPTEIKAILDTSASNTGFKWSSAKGPDIKISSGTICAAEITVSRQRPISLVIPIFKKTLGVE